LRDFPDSWLLLINLLSRVPADSKTKTELTAHLYALKIRRPQLADLISRGINSLELNSLNKDTTL